MLLEKDTRCPCCRVHACNDVCAGAVHADEELPEERGPPLSIPVKEHFCKAILKRTSVAVDGLEWKERIDEMRTKTLELEFQIKNEILSFDTFCENVSTALIECMKMKMRLQELIEHWGASYNANGFVFSDALRQRFKKSLNGRS